MMINPVLRAAAVYFFLLILFRFMGKRSLSQATTFDFILLLIISEATQNAMIGDDFSITNAYIVIGTLVAIDLVLNLVKNHWKLFDKVAESVPLVLVSDGKVHTDRIGKIHIELDDILEAARRQHGFANFAPIRYAVLEVDGTITIIPKEDQRKYPRGHSEGNAEAKNTAS